MTTGGLVEALDDAGGDDADDSGVPALGPEDEAAGTGALLGLGDGLDEHALLDLAAVGVGLVEVRGERAGLGEARGAEELEADGGVVEAAGGVDAGAEMEADLAGAHGPFGLEVSDFLEGADAGALGVGERVEAVANEDAVGSGEGDDVADGGERDEVHERLERGLAAGVEPAEGAKRAPERHHEVEGDAGGAQGLGGVLAAGLVGIEDGDGGRQRGGNGVVVDDDHVHAELAGACDLGDAGDAAVERDEEPGPLAGDALDGAGVESVPLVDAVRNVGLRWSADGVEEEGEERGGADAVDVVVAVEGDLLSLDDGAGEPLHGGGHALHPEGVREVAEIVREEPGGVLRIGDTAGDEDAGGERIEPELDGEAPGRAPLGLDISITTRKHPAQRPLLSCKCPSLRMFVLERSDSERHVRTSDQRR
jgi:hypothetical protein